MSAIILSANAPLRPEKSYQAENANDFSSRVSPVHVSRSANGG